MFTMGAFIAIGLIAWLVGRVNVSDRSVVAALTDDQVRTAILHARQDIKLVAFLLGAILVMLGVVADALIRH